MVQSISFDKQYLIELSLIVPAGTGTGNAVLTHGVALAQLERAVHLQHRCLVLYCYSYCYCVGIAVNGCYVCLLQTSGRRLVQDHERGDTAMTARLLKAERQKSKVKKKSVF